MILSNEVECDEAYVVAGHKGQPDVVKSKGRKGRRRRRKSKAGRGTMEKEKPPVFGIMERGGQVVMPLLANVQQKTIEPFIKDTIELGCLNRLLSVDRFLDSRGQSRLFSAWWGSIFKASASSQAGQPRPRALFVTV